MSALGSIDPVANPGAWDAVYIAGILSPGLAVFGEWARKHDFDIKSGKGSLGATITFVQKPPAEGSIDFMLWDNGTLGTGHNHFQEWDAFQPLLKYDPTKKQIQAVEIWHPGLDAIEVASVVCVKIGNLVHVGDGMYKVSCDFLEYFPPPPHSAVSTPTGSTTTAPNPPGPPGNPQPSADDEYEKQIAALLQQAQQP